MRIVSGKYKGRRIHLPANIHIRPTTDFAKESLFNILNNKLDFDGLTVLDLYSGTGSISYEFVSRGATEVIAVDNNYKSVEYIRNNIAILGITNMKVLRMHVNEFLTSNKRQFDVVFADPPYDMPDLPLFVEVIREKMPLADDGIFVLEHAAAHNFADTPGFIEARHYGSVHFSFFIF